MKKSIISSIITAVLLVFAVSCSKEGAQGPAGPAGKDGAANVQTVTGIATWTYDSPSLTYYYDLYSSAVTSSAISSGAVFGYASGGTDAWYPLPYTTSSGGQYTFLATTGMVEFQFHSTNGTTQIPTANLGVKIVIVPPAVMKSHPDIDFSNYADVKAKLNLSE